MASEYDAIRKNRLNQGQAAKERVYARLTQGPQRQESEYDFIRNRPIQAEPELPAVSSPSVNPAMERLMQSGDRLKDFTNKLEAMNNAADAKKSAVALQNTIQPLRNITNHTNVPVKPTFPQLIQDASGPNAALAQAVKESAGRTYPDKYANDPPVIKQIHQGLDKLAGVTKPIADIGMELYTPGGGISAVNAGMRGAGAVLERIAPRIAFGGSRGAQTAAKAFEEAAVGAPLGAGNELAKNPEASNRELLESAGYGAGLGAALPVAGGLIGGTFSKIRNLRRPVADTTVPAERTGQEISAEVRPQEPVQTRMVESDPIISQPENVVSAVQKVKERGVRGFTQTLEQSPNTSSDVADALRASDNRNYEPITNRQTLEQAARRIDTDAAAAESYVMNGTRSTAEQVATGMRLIQQYQQSGQVERAVTLAENLSKRLTEAGQAVQAASIWNRLTPEGALLAAQRKVNAVNEELLIGETPRAISPQQAKNITDAAATIQASGASSERAGNVMEIMERIRKGESVSGEDRQTVADFVADAKRFLKPEDGKPPRAAARPKEMRDSRVRDRVTSFLEEQEQAAKERLRAKGARISSNPIDVWLDYAYIGALKLAKGTIKFADWSEQMVKDVGDDVRPFLKDLYERSKDQLNASAKKIEKQTISHAERVAESYLKTNKITGQDAKFIRNLAQKISSLSGAEQRAASQDLQAIMNGFEKVGIGRKISTLQYLAMLFNPKTQIRNIVGNELMYRLERLSRLIATPLDIAYSKLTGADRTVTFKKGPEVWDNFFRPTVDFFTALPEGAKAGWRGVNPEGLTTKYDIQGLAFRSKYNPLKYMEQILGAALQGFDYAGYTRVTNQRMREMAYLDALNKGVKGSDAIRSHMETFLTNMDDEIHNIAREYGKYATLQDDSLLAQKLMGFRRGLNKVTAGNPDFGLGSLVVPFAKTPANLLLRGLDYTPAGILKAVKQAYDVLRKPNTDLTRADVISSVSRALTGTGMGALAYWIADKGALFGQSNDDSETRKLQQMVGIKDFQINGSALSRMLEAMATGGDIDAAAKLKPGDTLWSYEWAQPTSMPMAIGSNIYQGTKDKQSAMKTAGEAALAGAGTLFNSSVLSGIREAFQIPPGEDNAVKAIGMNLIKQAPGMFTPSLLRQINTVFDDKVRETYTPSDALSIVNPARAAIPGQAQQLPQKVDTLGNPITRANDFFDVFVSPSDRSSYRPTPEAQFVMDLLNETGDKSVAPRAVAKYLSGKDKLTGLHKKVDLTPEQFVRLQTLVGQETARRISLIDPTLPTDTKVKRVLKAMDAAGKKGRDALKDEVGLR